MKLALLADIHGNGDALRAVLADIDERGGVDQLLVLGDIVPLGPDPGEVVELLMARGAIGVYGNTDRFLLDTNWHTFQPHGEEDEADRALSLWALERLGERAEAWMRALPFQEELEIGGQRLLMVHGSPRDERDVIKADTPDDTVREMILDRRPASEIKRQATSEGMRFLRDSALDKVKAGVTTLEEINKVTFVS